MSNIRRGLFAIAVAACAGCLSPVMTGGMSGDVTSGGASGPGTGSSGTGTGGSSTGTPPQLCDPPCTAHASCDAGPTGHPACNCDPGYGLCETDGGPQCTDFVSNDNCGGCGVACFGLNEACASVDGEAACFCADGGPGINFESCNGSCTDTNSDPFNCGTCGNVCVSGACFPGDAGTGVCVCPSPYTTCGEDCVDLASSQYYCGSCDLSCFVQGAFPPLVCSDGQCLCGPAGNDRYCQDGTCTNLATNPDDCGECGNVCTPPTGACVDGGCVPN